MSAVRVLRLAMLCAAFALTLSLLHLRDRAAGLGQAPVGPAETRLVLVVAR